MISTPLAPNKAFRLALALMISACALGATAQSSLKIPQNAAELKELMQEPDGKPCTTCGVIVSMRTQSKPPSKEKGAPNMGMNPALDPGPGGELATVPIGKTGAANPPKPDIIYVVTVRYDSGAYGFIEQSVEPKLKKGERVRVTDGRVEPY
jgi:hypothetical protein